MKALMILVGLLSTAIALLMASGLNPASIKEAVAAGSACGFAVLGGLCFVAYAILVMASKMEEAEEASPPKKG